MQREMQLWRRNAERGGMDEEVHVVDRMRDEVRSSSKVFFSVPRTVEFPGVETGPPPSQTRR